MILVMEISNALTALAYILIPACIFIVGIAIKESEELRDALSGKSDLIRILFMMFILSCGATHIMDIVVLYSGVYWMQAIIQLITGVISMATAITLLAVAVRGR